MKNKKLLKVLLILLAAVAAGVVYTLAFAGNASDSAGDVVISDSGTENEEDETQEETGEEEQNDAADPDTTDADEFCVHVCGCVNSPGVYFLAAGSRVYQAVEAAGGLTDEAAGWYINQAAYVSDGEQIYIPSEEEAESGDVASAAAGQEDDDDLININTATAEELTELSGIGESKAAAIIAYREENGDFSSIEEIMNVSGIGEGTYEQFKDKIKV